MVPFSNFQLHYWQDSPPTSLSHLQILDLLDILFIVGVESMISCWNWFSDCNLAGVGFDIGTLAIHIMEEEFLQGLHYKDANLMLFVVYGGEIVPRDQSDLLLNQS